MIAQNVYIISDFNIFSEQDVNEASEYMTELYDHHHGSSRFTRNVDGNSYRPLVSTKKLRVATIE
jgi:hypothetical protein